MKNKKIILFLISQAITLFGSSIVQFALIWYVSLSTSSGLWLSILTVSAYLPQFIVSFISGTWADKYNKKILIIIADAMIAIATLLLAFLLFKIKEESIVLVLLAIISIIRSIGAGIQTPAVNALIPEIVSADKYMQFNGLNSIIQSCVQFSAPLIAAVILSYFTLQASLFIDVITALVGISILSTLSLPSKNEKTVNESLFQQIKSGIKYSITQTTIGKVLLIFGIFIFLCVPTGFMTSLFISRYYGDSYWYLTTVELSGFIGMIIGGLLLSVIKYFKNGSRTLFIGVLLFGIIGNGMGLIDNFIIYVILMFLYGIAIAMVQTSATTLLQENTDLNMQGRVFGLFSAIYSGFLPLGMIVFGPLADIISLRLLIIITSILLFIMGLCISKFRVKMNTIEKEEEKLNTI